MHEASAEDTPHGRYITSDGWFVLNLADALAETGQEGFLVLWGECTLVVEDEERTLRQWDYFHCPPETHHVFVGAGDGPCAVS